MFRKFCVLSLLLVGGAIFCTNDTKSDELKENIVTCYPCIGFKNTLTAYAQSKNFYVNLDARDQKTPGRSFINTIEHIKDTTHMDGELWREFGTLQSAVIKALHKAFYGDEKDKLVNVACLMNLARGEGTHVHFHILPRYRNPITLVDPETQEEVVFEDKFYGKPYDFNQTNYRQISDAMRFMIMKKIQEHLDLSDVPGGELKRLE